MKNLIIIGARGFGREVFGFVHTLDAYRDGEWRIKGFLDDRADALEGLRCGYGAYPPILGPVETYEPLPDDLFFCALGDCRARRKYAEMILAKGGGFASLVSPDAAVSGAARIGRGCIVSRWCSVSNNVEIGDFTMLHSFCTLGHDVKIGAFNSIESYCFFGGYSQTGECTTFHVRSGIIPHKRVGSGAHVGFGSVVMRNFGDGVHLFGNPAKRLEF